MLRISPQIGQNLTESILSEIFSPLQNKSSVIPITHIIAQLFTVQRRTGLSLSYMQPAIIMFF